MRILPSVAAVALCLATLAPVFAQPASERALVNAGNSLVNAQKQEALTAARPGDELLTCDQLQAEMGATMNTSTVHESTAAIGATAQAERERAERMQAQAKANIATNMALGVASSVIPGAGYAQSAAMMAQARAQQKEGEAGQMAYAGMLGNMQDMMPAMMRGQHLVELGQAKNCPFTADIPRQ